MWNIDELKTISAQYIDEVMQAFDNTNIKDSSYISYSKGDVDGYFRHAYLKQENGFFNLDVPRSLNPDYKGLIKKENQENNHNMEYLLMSQQSGIPSIPC